MSGLIYLTLKGESQGLISAGCMSQASVGNKAQLLHFDQILIYGMTHAISRVQNVNHQRIVLIKSLDKSSPLLTTAIIENEFLSCIFDFYRTNQTGHQERYYQIKLTDARIAELEVHAPHSIRRPAQDAQEKVELNYRSISWEHIIAGTSTYSLWEERLF